MSAMLQRHELGVTWIEQSSMSRTAHAILSDGRVWLIDPFEDDAAPQAASALGPPAGVLQLLDRHNRDCQTIATGVGIPLLRLPERVPETPFEVVPILFRRRWREVALWWPQMRALIIPEAIGTAPVFALGRRAGVHPMLRLMPPRAQLSAYEPSMLLLGHGRAIESEAAAALGDALDRSRSDIPRLLVALPGLIRG
ncbi:MAG: hypothetical protein JO342_11760 [Solirubrobacterales bacterium]|nr:hypothetical protein [Solirubrobacterales bacterium]